MFWFGKKYKYQADKIVHALHDQISDAMKINESMAFENLYTSFFVGYFQCFLRAGFVVQGVPGKKAGWYVMYICNEIQIHLNVPKFDKYKPMPEKLDDIYRTALKRLDLAIEVGKGKGFTPTATAIERAKFEKAEYEKGGLAGMWDGSNLIAWDERASRTNLKSYLLGQELDYLEL